VICSTISILLSLCVHAVLCLSLYIYMSLLVFVSLPLNLYMCLLGYTWLLLTYPPQTIAVQAVINECSMACERVDHDALDSDSQNSSELDSDEYSSDDMSDGAMRWRFRLARYKEREVSE
jgi:hypothetical protein